MKSAVFPWKTVFICIFFKIFLQNLKVYVKIDVLVYFGVFGKCLRGLRLLFEKPNFNLICIMRFCVFCFYLAYFFKEIKEINTQCIFYPKTRFLMLNLWEFYKFVLFSNFCFFIAIFGPLRHIRKCPKCTMISVSTRTKELFKKNYENIQRNTVFRAKIALFSRKNGF